MRAVLTHKRYMCVLRSELSGNNAAWMGRAETKYFTIFIFILAQMSSHSTTTTSLFLSLVQTHIHTKFCPFVSFFTLELFRRRTLDCENKGGTMVAASMAKFWHVLSIRPAVVVSDMVLVVRYVIKTFSSPWFFGEKLSFNPPPPNGEDLFFPLTGERQAYRICKIGRPLWTFLVKLR